MIEPTTPSPPPWYRAAAERPDTSGGTGRVMVTVPLSTLVDLLDPLHADPWSVGPITPRQVQAALGEGRLRAENPCWESTEDVAADSNAHAERIAWLVRHGWDTSSEALTIDVDEYGGIALCDGNHRLYALAFLGLDGPVTIDVAGYLDVAETLLGVVIP